MFYLKQYNKTLIQFEITEDKLDGQRVNIVKMPDRKSEYLLPIGVELTGDSLMKWLRNRIIPKNREYVDSFLAKNGLSHNDTKGILQVCKGLSLNDSYWVVEDENEKFEDYNLYEHDFLKVLSLIAYTGYGSSRAKGFTSSTAGAACLTNNSLASTCLTFLVVVFTITRPFFGPGTLPFTRM